MPKGKLWQKIPFCPIQLTFKEAQITVKMAFLNNLVMNYTNNQGEELQEKLKARQLFCSLG